MIQRIVRRNIARILIPIVMPFALLFTLASAAMTEANTDTDIPYILPYEQFANLTRAEQNTYVVKLREMMIKIEERNPKAAAELLRGSSLLRKIASMTLPEAQAQNAATEDMRLSEKTDQQLWVAKEHRAAVTNMTAKPELSDAEKSSLLSRYKSALERLEIAQQNASSVSNRSEKNVLLKAVQNELETLKGVESNVLQKIPASEVEKARVDFAVTTNKIRESQAQSSGTKAPPPSAALPPPTNTASSGAPTMSITTAPAATVTAPTAPRAPPSTAPRPPAATVPRPPPSTAVRPPTAAGVRPPAVVAVPKAPASTAAPPAAATGTKPVLFRCMHSGFVIKGAKCLAPTTLPMDLANIDEKTFVCDEGKVMCNPFVFGVTSNDCDWTKPITEACWKNAKPLCIQSHRWASKRCFELGKSKNARESAVEIILANKTAYDQFAKDMASLCLSSNIDYAASFRSKEDVKADIDETCKIALAETKQVLARFGGKYPTKTTAQSKINVGAPGATTAPAAAAPAAAPATARPPAGRR